MTQHSHLNYEMSNHGFNRGYMKRMQREMRCLTEAYKHSESNFDEKTQSHSISCRLDNWIVEIRVPQMFPFKPPQVLINEKYYRDMLIFRDSEFQNILRANGIECLCCKSLLCTSNWCPIKKIVDVVDEVKSHRDLIRAIIYTRLVREICQDKGITCQEIPAIIMGQMYEGKLPIVPY